MMIRISYFPEAEDRLDAEAMDPKFSYYDSSISDAHDTLLMLKRVVDMDNREKAAENAGADTLQPEEDTEPVFSLKPPAELI